MNFKDMPELAKDMIATALECFFDEGAPEGQALYVRAAKREGQLGFQVVINTGLALAERIEAAHTEVNQGMWKNWQVIRKDLLEVVPDQVTIVYDTTDYGGSIVLDFREMYTDHVARKHKEMN